MNAPRHTLPRAAACLLLAACGQSGVRAGAHPSGYRPTVHAARVTSTAARTAVWKPGAHVRGVVDLAGPGADGSFFVAAHGRLFILGRTGAVRSIAPDYAAPPGLEPYIALSSGQAVPGAGCRFAGGALYALRLARGDGVTEVAPSGRVRRFAILPSRGLEDGIAFDQTGRFGHRLLVTSSAHAVTTVYAIDCAGRVRTITRSAPRVEGGIAVAPASFGRFGGDLVAPDEVSGRILAIAASGRVSLVADSGLPHGQDIGVESEGFVPATFRSALVADRLTRRSRHPGDDVVLAIARASLRAAGVRSGDLLAVSEGGAATVAVRCAAVCTTRRVASGVPRAHIEGHVAFTG